MGISLDIIKRDDMINRGLYQITLHLIFKDMNILVFEYQYYTCSINGFNAGVGISSIEIFYKTESIVESEIRIYDDSAIFTVGVKAKAKNQACSSALKICFSIFLLFSFFFPYCTGCAIYKYVLRFNRVLVVFDKYYK